MPPVSGRDTCFSHSPDFAAERAAARKQGGWNRRAVRGPGSASPVSLQSVDGIRVILERTVDDTLALENSAQRNRAIGGLLLVALWTLEIGEIEARLRAVEDRIQATPPRRIA